MTQRSRRWCRCAGRRSRFCGQRYDQGDSSHTTSWPSAGGTRKRERRTDGDEKSRRKSAAAGLSSRPRSRAPAAPARASTSRTSLPKLSLIRLAARSTVHRLAAPSSRASLAIISPTLPRLASYPPRKVSRMLTTVSTVSRGGGAFARASGRGPARSHPRQPDEDPDSLQAAIEPQGEAATRARARQSPENAS